MSMSVEKIFDNNWNVEQVDNNLPLISVIILTYKQQNYLFDTIKSVLEQDYPSLELILSDVEITFLTQFCNYTFFLLHSFCLENMECVCVISFSLYPI